MRGHDTTKGGRRVLMVTANYPPQCGGVQVHAFELARRLAARCERFAVIAPSHRDSREVDQKLPFRVHRVPDLGENLALSAIPPVARLVARYDAIYATHGSAAFAALVAGRGQRVVVAAHGKEILSEPFPELEPLNRIALRVQRHVYERAHAFVAVSRFTADLLRRRSIRETRIHTIPNGVDPRRFSPGDTEAAKVRLGLAGRLVLLSVCRLVGRKGVDRVLDVLPSLVRRWPDIAYVVVGDGPERRRLERHAARLGVARNVVWRGEVDYVHGPIVDFYDACDVFVLPASSELPDVEGFGIVYLEANACGKPTVALDDGGVTDAVVDGLTGLLVAPDDRGALEQALAGLIANPMRARELGAAGRARVEQQLDWEIIARRILVEALFPGGPALG
ncbi:MAG TPA: glycosyltransferase family 4 protein [Labilithrix sp.]|nr:glycosyltransferase family 4 protein [Labilithrix sp.]